MMKVPMHMRAAVPLKDARDPNDAPTPRSSSPRSFPSSAGEYSKLNSFHSVSSVVTEVADSSSSPRRNRLIEGRRLAFLETDKELQAIAKSPSRRALFPPCGSSSRAIVENKYFVAFTAALTMYALIGDDARLLWTNKPADVIFDYFTLICLICFTTEIILSCFGRSDYMFGFFFLLDVISTATLVLDFTWVRDKTSSSDGMDRMRSGRTARIGARAGRVVRVIRLVRILRMYKAMYFAKKEKRRPSLEEGSLVRSSQSSQSIERSSRTSLESDDWEDEDDEDRVVVDEVQESRVGKKLSEMTTQRVIVLVLTMLIALPYMQADTMFLTLPAPYFAADNVLEAFRGMRRNSSLAVRYQRTLLKLIYYHNWYTANSGDDCPGGGEAECSSQYYSSLFWFGIRSSEEDALQSVAEAAKLDVAQVAWFQQRAAAQNDLYNFGVMPANVEGTLSSAWLDHCNEPTSGIYRRGLSVLQDRLDDVVTYAVPCPEDLRMSEKTTFKPLLVSSSSPENWQFEFVFDLRPFSRLGALYGILITLFICVVLTIASLYFSNDANTLVLGPVEKMMEKLETIRHNPLVAMKMADDEFREEEKMRAKLRKQETMQTYQSWYAIWQRCRCSSSSGAKAEPMETVVLEKTIIKLGSLLALGFGEAGANIIGHSMRSGDIGSINVMVTGSVVDCIIGCARIMHFSTATEVLQGKVLTFVNQIAEIVHGVINEYHGAPNRNTGDTFLLIWRISGGADAYRTQMADMSMIACAKILGAVHQSPVLATYRRHPGLQQRLGTKYRVGLTFGVHAGWAIEGAVGSEYKIDASYLSPNVSITYGVEQATRTYGVPMLFTETVVQLTSAGMAKKCRLIDRVYIHGSKLPLTLHCLDLDCTSLQVSRPRDPQMPWNSRQRFKARQFLEVEKVKKLDPNLKMEELFDGQAELARMRHNISTEFVELFNMGYQNYAEGEWEVAERLLTKARGIVQNTGVGDDGPSIAIIRFMESPYLFVAPEGWDGVRDLEQAFDPLCSLHGTRSSSLGASGTFLRARRRSRGHISYSH